MVRPPVGHKYTPKTTPLHVYQLVMQLLKITFTRLSGEEDFPFTYTDDPKTTGISLDTIFSKESPNYGVRPLVIVSRGNISSQPSSMGDMAESYLSQTREDKTSLVQSNVTIKTLSKRSGEVDILSNIIYGFLVSCRTVLPSLTSIHQIKSMDMSPVSTLEGDDHMYYTQASMEYVMQYQWTWDFTPVLLEGIGLHIINDLVLDLK